MSTFYVLKCEMCDNTFKLPSAGFARPYEYVMPEEWITLTKGNPQLHEAQHFCSKACLAKWAGVLHPPLVAYDAPPPTKMRRFLLVDGETADITEGIQYSDGKVGINYGSPHSAWANWEAFKAGHDGSGIQWIDPEVSDGN